MPDAQNASSGFALRTYRDFVFLNYQFEQQDTDNTRKKILAIPYAEWKKRGFSKRTLHYMKKNAEGDQPFTLNKHGRERLGQWDQSVDVPM